MAIDAFYEGPKLMLQLNQIALAASNDISH
jgi:hypothetical protein